MCVRKLIYMPLQNKGKDKGDSKGSSPVPPAPIAAPTPPTTPGQTLRLAAAARAQKFLKAQFGASSAGRGAQTEGAKLLREICGDLGQAGAVARLLEVLRENGGAEVSTHAPWVWSEISHLRVSPAATR